MRGNISVGTWGRWCIVIMGYKRVGVHDYKRVRVEVSITGIRVRC